MCGAISVLARAQSLPVQERGRAADTMAKVNVHEDDEEQQQEEVAPLMDPDEFLDLDGRL